MITAENIKKIKARAAELTSGMTLEEKVFQLLHNAPAIERLGIRKYCWWNEALHGVARSGVATVFPQAIAMAAAFDEAMVERTADIISTEARAKYNEYQRKGDFSIYKGLTFWSPNVNIFRDPRWGRGHETYGEDPFLTSRTGAAFVRGIQGNNPRFLKAAACAKHYVAHSGPEQGRHSFDSAVSPKDLYETYLPAFRECVKEGVEAVMGAYNRVNGEVCCGSRHLLGDILRGELGFDGHVVSDCGAISNFHNNHHVTNAPHESAAMAVNAGCDLNCGDMYMHLLPALEEGLTDEATISRSVERLMATRIKLGIVDGGDGEDCPYDDILYSENDSPAHREAAYDAACRSMVLLKNDGTLPLSSDSRLKIAVIGPNADSRKVLEGNYNGTASHYYTILRGFLAYESESISISYAEGCHLYNEKVEGCGEYNDRMSEALSTAEQADVTVLCVGLDPTIEGEEGDAYNGAAGGDKLDLELPGLQNMLIDEICALGKPVIVVNLSGSAVNLSHAQKAGAIIQAWYPGENGGLAVAGLVFGKYSPAGRLPVTFYRSVDELPPFTDYSMKGRTYRYYEGEALYPFGYGLSYTSFAYGKAKLSENVISDGGSVICSAELTNTGDVASDEVVQLYIKDDERFPDAPVCRLRGYKRIHVAAHEAIEVEFTLTAEDFKLVNAEGESVLESGVFTLCIGGCAPVKGWNKNTVTAKIEVV